MIISLFVSIINPSITARADWRNDAYDFITSYGEQNAMYTEDAFWFGQWGTISGTLKYRIIGWQISVTVNGGTYKINSAIGHTVNYVNERDVSNKRYSLWKINYSDIVAKLKRKHPSVDFSSLVDNSVASIYKFDAIMCTGNLLSDGTIRNNATIDDDGNVLSGTAYFTAEGIKGAANWQGSAPDELDKLYNIYAKVPAGQKPVPPTPGVYGTLIEPGRSGWESYPTTHYHVANSPDYWVNLRDRFTFYVEGSIPKSYYGTACPDYLYAKMDNGSGLDIRIYTAEGTDKWYPHSGYAINFQQTETSTWISDNTTSNYLITHFRMKAMIDNKTYRFYSMATKGSTNSGWKDTGQNLKTDGTAPASKTLPSHKFNNPNELKITQYGIYDNGSGLKYNSVVAKVYKEGTSSSVSEISMDRVTQFADYSKTINFNNYSHLKDYYGNFVVEVWATDNVGNKGKVSSTTVTRVSPAPKNHSVEIKEYEYEDTTTKWVKLNDNFKVCNSVEAYKGTGINGFDVIYDLNRNTADYNPYFKAWVYNGGIDYKYTHSGFSQLGNSQAINSEYVDSIYNRYSKCINSVANNMSLNGYKFAVWSRVNYSDGTTNRTTSWIKDPKLLGIDGKAPSINWTGNGSNVTISIEDKESGFNRAEVTVNGNKTTYWTPNITLPQGSNITITVYDNVGNSATKVIPGGYWDGKYIKTWETTVNGKKVLKYMVDAEIWDFWYDSNGYANLINHSLAFSASSSIYLAGNSKYVTATNSIYYEGLIEDKVNQPYGPTLNYKKNNSTYAKIVWSHIEDITDNVSLRLYKDSAIWDEVYKGFASGRKDYKWVLYQTGDRYGNSITRTKVGEGTTAGTEVDMSTYKTGAYEIEVTMYDKNGNPSGTTKYPFQHTQPEVNTDVSDLFLKVTAVKDLNWESMDYPIKYNSLEFPLGKNKLSKNGEGIKLGYVVNFSIENLIKHNLADWNATYTLLGENGELLSATSNGKTLKESDTKDGTGYLYQPKKQILSDKDPSPDSSNNGYADRLFFKHFIPADAEFFKTDGSVYRGKVNVRVKIYLKEVGTDGKVGENTYTVDLYTIDTADSAYNDLIIDKQR